MLNLGLQNGSPLKAESPARPPKHIPQTSDFPDLADTLKKCEVIGAIQILNT